MVSSWGLIRAEKVYEGWRHPRPTASLTYKAVRREIFQSLPTKQADVVMLGDSLTEQFPWGEAAGCTGVVNRGISGDTTQDILNRLPEITVLKPKRVVLMAGINDFISGDYGRTADNLVTIITKLQRGGVEVVWIPILPVAAYDRHGWNPLIVRVNDEVLRQVSRVKVLDLLGRLRLADGALDPAMTYDGVHLRAEAYDKIIQLHHLPLP